MREGGLGRGLLLALALTAVASAADPPIPQPQGFVTDLAGVISPDARQRMTRIIEALRAKTGSEIAVLTVPTTEPLDDFTYGMRVADAWKVGGKRDDTGVLVLVATKDRKLRILTGYGIEGILPDGLVGQIEDREILPSFRAGNFSDGIERGVTAIAQRISDGYEGKPPPTPQDQGIPIPPWALLLILLLVFFFLVWLGNQTAGRGGGRRYPGGWGGGFGGLPPGGFGSGGGGFDGFGGGRFGGGGAGRSW